MDLREIQRLHAQFAPDLVTIDLPRQIAALPAPVAEKAEPLSKLQWGTPTSGRFVRSCAAPMLIAMIVALAGIGAARLYSSFSTLHEKAVGASIIKHNKAKLSTVPDTAGLRPVDATPAHPAAIASASSTDDLGHASTHSPATSLPELTANQFRTSLTSVEATSPTKTSGATKPAPPVLDQPTLAAVSPIRQGHRGAETAHPNTKEPAQPTQAPQAAQGESKPVVTVATPETPVAPTAQPIPQPQTLPAAPTRSYRRHVEHAHDTKAHDGEQSSATPNTKPASTSRPSSNEVQIF